jgi:hypothetical protein
LQWRVGEGNRANPGHHVSAALSVRALRSTGAAGLRLPHPLSPVWRVLSDNYFRVTYDSSESWKRVGGILVGDRRGGGASSCALPSRPSAEWSRRDASRAEDGGAGGVGCVAARRLGKRRPKRVPVGAWRRPARAAIRREWLRAGTYRRKGMGSVGWRSSERMEFFSIS